ncbi:MAG: nucleotidyltransferase family protein [Gammaproteobacteria bacterium]|nr:nucleotidyltransferase family protein [Gammaproteobacteria bacterium]
MKAMILAAGRGNRLRPLTDNIPKALLRVGKCTLIEHHIHKLALAGFESIIINTAYRGKQIRNYLGDGSSYKIPISYSDEGEQALETGGGISYALPLLGDEPILVISADIYCRIPFDATFKLRNSDMHLLMVNNPEHNPNGDFYGEELNIKGQSKKSFTYSGIAYIDPKLFIHEKRIFPLIDTIRHCINHNAISADIFNGAWFDIGTGSRLHTANKFALCN